MSVTLDVSLKLRYILVIDFSKTIVVLETFKNQFEKILDAVDAKNTTTLNKTLSDMQEESALIKWLIKNTKI